MNSNAAAAPSGPATSAWRPPYRAAGDEHGEHRHQQQKRQRHGPEHERRPAHDPERPPGKVREPGPCGHDTARCPIRCAAADRTFLAWFVRSGWLSARSARVRARLPGLRLASWFVDLVITCHLRRPPVASALAAGHGIRRGLHAAAPTPADCLASAIAGVCSFGLRLHPSASARSVHSRSAERRAAPTQKSAIASAETTHLLPPPTALTPSTTAACQSQTVQRSPKRRCLPVRDVRFATAQRIGHFWRRLCGPGGFRHNLRVIAHVAGSAIGYAVRRTVVITCHLRRPPVASALAALDGIRRGAARSRACTRVCRRPAMRVVMLL